MSTDRRRILGPADAVRPVAAPPVSAENTARHHPDEPVRKFFIKTGLSKNANGLAYLEIDDTIIEVGIFGPRPIKGLFVNRASFTVETKFLPHVTQPSEVLFNGSQAAANGRLLLTNIEQKLSTFVETAFLPAVLLEKYPKSTIDVFVNVLAFNANTSSMLNLAAWIINCTSLAMVDSGIEVRDMVTCGHVKTCSGLAEMDALIATDSDAEKGTECVASFMAMHNNDMVAVWVQGSDGDGVSESVMLQLLEGCQEMSTIVRKNLNGFLLDLAK
ncbi:hypothetical protein METBIDRAFT_37274 [Metschnikowia bicuspidata var. bicuspidata NRRL YB-4993]|uniref:Exoribonuclease phosphorolytic domain-containing protein n=1 Tax=Metschnikowia bicuspidata var. bicuspidata NRRL YB-4993 TaxID=869754 RepID=A0A1A0HGN1_9ASCO|nr:hypothetical protein METBIDRAFT_37274 [Metschnikowia bicuspidata var. bicuspidata NRRL YB-4993]OBA23037.1 hypothetical protein METBIDRAFT_37274 [Metschnikowia bicuspidata var. bicuspidata NRRL YB-4993]